MPSPVARVQYYDKVEKKAYDVAAVFDNQHHEWKQDLAPERAADLEHRFPKMLLSDAAKRCERKDGYLSIVWPKTQTPKPDRDLAGDDNDLPF